MMVCSRLGMRWFAPGNRILLLWWLSSRQVRISHVFFWFFRLLCLYCEKTFKDRFTLKEHMRKKLHKKLNPNNKEYDQFYLVNYIVGGLCMQVQNQCVLSVALLHHQPVRELGVIGSALLVEYRTTNQLCRPVYCCI